MAVNGFKEQPGSMKISWIITVSQGQAGPERGPSLLSFTLSSSSSRDLPLFPNLSVLLLQRLSTTSVPNTRRGLEKAEKNRLRFMQLCVGLEKDEEIPSLRFSSSSLSPALRLCWRQPLKCSRCSLHHSYDPRPRYRGSAPPPPLIHHPL